MLLALLQIIVILLRCQQAFDIIRVGHVTPVNMSIKDPPSGTCFGILLEQPSIREWALVDQSWTVLDLLVLLCHLPCHGAKHVAGGLDRLQHAALLIIKLGRFTLQECKLSYLAGSQLCVRVRQLNVDNVTQSIGGISGDPDCS